MEYNVRYDTNVRGAPVVVRKRGSSMRRDVCLRRIAVNMRTIPLPQERTSQDVQLCFSCRDGTTAVHMAVCALRVIVCMDAYNDETVGVHVRRASDLLHTLSCSGRAVGVFRNWV